MGYLNKVDIRSWEGQVLKNKLGLNFKIIDYVNSKEVKIEFIDSGFKKTCQMKEVRTGSIKDTSKPSVLGVGIVGSKYLTKDEVTQSNTQEYEAWRGLLTRCYSSRLLKKRPTYLGCIASENFKHYEYFYEWCQNQIGFKERWNLDKDVLVKGNKVYSEDTCVFVPDEINCALCKTDKLRGKFPIGVHWDTNKKVFIAQVNRGKGYQEYLGKFTTPEEAFEVYKKAKEAYLKDLAEKWRGRVDERVYCALMNYQVEITD